MMRASDRLPVLVVEDDQASAELARRHLSRASRVVLGARRVDEALALLSRERFRAAILDYRLEDGYGWPVLDAARASDPPLPVIMVTGAGDERVAAEAIRRGAADYVVKTGRCWEELPEIVDRVTRQAASDSQNALLAAIVQHSDEGILSISLTGEVMTWNPAAERILGHRDDEAVGLPYARMVPEDHAVEFREMLETIRRGIVVETRDTIRLHLDGRRIEVAESAAPLRAPTGAITGAAVVVRDVTARHALEMACRHSQKMEAVGRLAGGVAHDFNNLLTVINGYTDILLSGLGEDDPLRQPLTEISRAGARATELTQQLLTFSRKRVVLPRVVGLNSVVSELVSLLRRLIRADIELEVMTAAPHDRVLGDPGQFEQVVMNLVVNARDAMPHGGRLTISTRNEPVAPTAPAAAEPTHVILSVADTGEGMNAETLSRIFEPFFTTKGPGIGTGLGLATVHGIATQCGGRIEVESVLGRGSRFDVILPLTPPERPASDGAPSADAGTGVQPPTILVADDDESVRSLVRVTLRRAGFRVLEAGRGDEALEVARREPGRIDVLLTDVVMPGMNGPQLALELCLERPGIPVIFMSGYADAARARLDPEANFLSKPFRFPELLRRVTAAIPR